jgi:hypothetical protein
MDVALLILVRGTSLWARAIQKATASPYSHVGMVIAGMTYEFDYGGFYSRPLATYAWSYDLYAIRGMDPERTEACQKWWNDHRKAPYDYGKVLSQGLELVFHWTGFRPIIDSDKAFSCSEAVGECLQAVELPLEVSPKSLVPGDIPWDPGVMGPLGPCQRLSLYGSCTSRSTPNRSTWRSPGKTWTGARS